MRWRALPSLLFLAFGLAASQGVQAALPCTPFSGSTLPATDPLTYKYRDPGHPEDDLTVTYRKWDDYCYADAETWQEWHDANNWLTSKGKPDKVLLSQRLDFYRRANQPLTEALPLVLYAHPGGPTEDFPDDSPQLRWVVMTLVKAGYAVASVESRHPLGSIVAPRLPKFETSDWPPVTKSPIPSDDIASAVRWLKFNKTAFGIDPTQVVVVGQSRGSAALLNALLNIPGDPHASDWRSKPSTVRGAYLYQAQTTYVEDELAQVFVADEGLFRYWMHQDTPDAILPPGGDPNRLPGSAVQLARTAPLDELVPVHLSYDHEAVLQPDGVHLKPQCFESNNRNRRYEGYDDDNDPDTKPVYDPRLMPRCPGDVDREVFDVHDPNYGQYFAQAYADRGTPERVTRCGGVGDDNVKGGYADLLGFVQSASQGLPYTPTCPAGGHVVPTPPPDTID